MGEGPTPGHSYGHTGAENCGFLGKCTKSRWTNDLPRFFELTLASGSKTTSRLTGDGVAAPAVTPEELQPIDAVLLSHDHHFDNLDHAGRQMLSTAGRVLTRMAGAERPIGPGCGPGSRSRHSKPGTWGKPLNSCTRLEDDESQSETKRFGCGTLAAMTEIIPMLFQGDVARRRI